MLKLDAKALSDYTRITSPLPGELQKRLAKITDDWISSKKVEETVFNVNGIDLRIYNRLPNGDDYAISRSKEVGRWAKFKRDVLRLPSQRGCHWSIVTDGHVNSDKDIFTEEEKLEVPGSDEVTPAEISCYVKIKRANFVALHGYKNKKLVAVRLFTVARGDELKGIINKTSIQYEKKEDIVIPPRIKILNRV